MSSARGTPALRQKSYVPAQDGVDKYQILADLQHMAPTLGLKARTLGVLAALCSFHPGRLIDDSVVIFASNATLSDRLHGMAESTLRRHLTHLIAAGLIARKDSPNRKRYALRAGGDQLAFGFSLAPLVGAATMIGEQAREAQEEAARRDMDLQALKSRLAALPPEADAVLRLKRLCRMAPTDARLSEITQALEALEAAQPRAEMNSAAAQNERHYRNINQNYSLTSEAIVQSVHNPTAPKPTRHLKTISLDHLLRVYAPALVYAQKPPESWEEVIALSYELSGSVGIGRQRWDHAVAVLGREFAAVFILKLVSKAAKVAHLPSYAYAALNHEIRLRLN